MGHNRGTIQHPGEVHDTLVIWTAEHLIKDTTFDVCTPERIVIASRINSMRLSLVYLETHKARCVRAVCLNMAALFVL